MAILIATEALVTVFLGSIRLLKVILYQFWGYIWIIIGNYPKVFKKFGNITQSIAFTRQRHLSL